MSAILERISDYVARNIIADVPGYAPLLFRLLPMLRGSTMPVSTTAKEV